MYRIGALQACMLRYVVTMFGGLSAGAMCNALGGCVANGSYTKHSVSTPLSTVLAMTCHSQTARQDSSQRSIRYLLIAGEYFFCLACLVASTLCLASDGFCLPARPSLHTRGEHPFRPDQEVDTQKYIFSG